MRHLLICFALLACFAAAPTAAEPAHDCLEGGSMDYTPLDITTPVPAPGS